MLGLALAALVTVAVDAQRLPQQQSQMRPIQCYSCLSGTLSDQSRAMFEQNGHGSNVPVDVCDDPFRTVGQQMQPCMTSCVKSVSENQFTRVVIRGCLTDVAQQLTGRSPNLRIPAPGQCIEENLENVNLGMVKTRTCLCDQNGCNVAVGLKISGFVMGLLLFFVAVIY
uniref:Protein quiver n=1 Tax=Bursaphelenchus xylophilus TaxID=6326 RepID=A0A1I7RHR6_BURXY